MSSTQLSALSGADVLITGGLGFIGSSLARRLVELGAHVTVVDSLIPEYGGNLFNVADIVDRLRVNISDVRDPYGMAHLVKQHQYLFNLAGQTSHVDSMTDPHTDLEINCRAQLSILEACRRHNPAIRVVFSSTRQIYGRPAYLPVDERHPVAPVDVNGINKLAGESYHTIYERVHGLWCCSLRLTNTYGPRMRIKDARQTFVGVWIRQLLEGKPIEVWGGDQLRDFTHVDDCVDALLLAATHEEARGKIFNLGGEPVISLRDLAVMLVSLQPGAAYVVKEFPASRKKIDIGDYYSDSSLIRSTLGWVPRKNLRAGFDETISYYRANLRHYT